MAREQNAHACRRGRTVSQALEARRIKKTELAATEVGILQRYKPVESPPLRSNRSSPI